VSTMASRAPWPPLFHLIVLPLSIPTKHGIAFSSSRHTSYIPLPIAFITRAPYRLCHVRRRLLCSWPGAHGSSPDHPRPPASACGPLCAGPPLHRHRRAPSSLNQQAPTLSPL
jgi:hypothetical protein